jgi:hypothetical protein
MRFSSSGFFHESIEPRPQINIPKYFRKIFRFRGDIRENILDLMVTIPGNCKNDP